MSCHDIGHGLNTVSNVVIELLDNNEISVDAARRIIAQCRKAVNWCDGNEGEAIEDIYKCRCGKCLKLVKKGEKLYNLWEFPYPENRDVDRKIVENKENPLATFCLCEECFDEEINKLFEDSNASEKWKKYYEEKCNPEDYLSNGGENV